MPAEVRVGNAEGVVSVGAVSVGAVSVGAVSVGAVPLGGGTAAPDSLVNVTPVSARAEAAVAAVGSSAGARSPASPPSPAPASPASAASPGSLGAAILVARQLANWSMIRPPTSCSTPRPNCAGRPVTLRSVSTTTLVSLSPVGSSRACTVAPAVPLPRLSVPFASSTTRRAASSRWRKRPLPEYCSDTGPSFTFTVPEKPSASTPVSVAPGKQGAIPSTSSSVDQARSTGAGTVNVCWSSTSNLRESGGCRGRGPPGRRAPTDGVRLPQRRAARDP